MLSQKSAGPAISPLISGTATRLQTACDVAPPASGMGRWHCSAVVGSGGVGRKSARTVRSAQKGVDCKATRVRWEHGHLSSRGGTPPNHNPPLPVRSQGQQLQGADTTKSTQRILRARSARCSLTSPWWKRSSASCPHTPRTDCAQTGGGGGTNIRMQQVCSIILLMARM